MKQTKNRRVFFSRRRRRRRLLCLSRRRACAEARVFVVDTLCFIMYAVYATSSLTHVSMVPTSRRCNATRRGGVVAAHASPHAAPASRASSSHVERASRQPALAWISILSCVMVSSHPAFAFDGDGASSFTSRGCVGCHAAGGNVVAPSATLFANDLAKNGVRAQDDVANVIALGRGKMPGYGEACAPKGACTFGARLDADEIDALATYVLERAAHDWK